MATACYIPQYLLASFKGVEFTAEETTSEHGRRGSEGEFPFGENTAYADLGRKIRRYTIKGRYQNNEHIGSSAQLIAACESPGPGLLIHPTRGAIMVACTKLSVTDDPLNAQGITNLDMEFVEANAIATGLSVIGSLFGLSTVTLFSAISDSFSIHYDLDNVRFYDVPAVLESSASVISTVRNEFGKAIVGTTDVSKWAAYAAMHGYVDDPASLRGSKTAFNTFRQSLTTLANATIAQSKYDSMKTIANKMATVSTLPEESGDAQNAVYAAVRTMASAFMLKAALEVPLETLDAALNRYDEIVAILDEELLAARSTCDDDLYIELRRFQTEAKTALLNAAYNLPALIEYNFHGSVHALVASYEIFDDATRFGEIEARNPGMLPWAMGPMIIASRG